VESAKLAYCAGFEHVGCGGYPIAWDQNHICCSSCKYRQKCDGDEPLGESLENPAWKVRGAASLPVVAAVQKSIFE
jgi:hypothetical protein